MQNNHIKSSDNIKIKFIKKLITKSSFRNTNKKYILEGKRAVFDADINIIDSVFVSERFFNVNSDSLKKYNITIIDDKIFKEISDTENSQGIIAVANFLEYNFDELISGRLAVILDGISDPGNMGTIIRTCEATGVDLLIIGENCVDIYNPKSVRASMGSITRQKILVSKDNKNIIEELTNYRYKLLVTDLDEASDYSKYAYEDKIALVMGSEANGVTEIFKKAAIDKIKINMNGMIESLNVAIATSVILFRIKDVLKL